MKQSFLLSIFVGCSIAFLSLAHVIDSPNTTAFRQGALNSTIDDNITYVTARRGYLEGWNTIANVSIINNQELYQRQLFNLNQALARITGVDVLNSGGQLGTISTLQVRGLRTQDVQLRVDGIRLNNRAFQVSQFIGANLATENGSIALLKGGYSSLYGGGAIAGVLKLELPHYREQDNLLRLETGSFSSFSTGNTLFHRSEKGLEMSLFYGYSTTENDTYGDNSETANFDNRFIASRAGFRVEKYIDDTFLLGGTFRYYRTRTQSPQFGGSLVHNESIFATVYGEWQPHDEQKTKLTLQWLSSNSDFGNGFLSGNEFQQWGFAVEHLRQLHYGTISVGIDYDNQRFRTDNILAEDNYIAGYLNYFTSLTNAWDVELGVRYEYYDSFGSDINYRASTRYDITATQSQISASFSTAFTPPNYFDLHFPPQNNPDLNPETATQFDITWQQQITDNLQWQVSYFQTQVSNLIDRTFGNKPFRNIDNNVDASGIESKITGQWQQWYYMLQYTWLNESVSDNQPQQQAYGEIFWQDNYAIWQVGFGLRFVDQRANTADDYWLGRLYVNYKINKYFSCYARIENIGNVAYDYTVFGTSYPARRFGAFAGIKITY